MSEPKKILIISHGHPEHSKGGGEIAAYNLHRAVDGNPLYQSVFFARHDQPALVHGGTAFSSTGRSNEVLFYSSMSDWFQFSQPDKPRIWRDFRELLEVCQPDLIHFHHYVHLGIEMIREVKNHNPKVPVVLTLHEYFGICHNYGQMVRTQDNALCFKSTPQACAECFPEKTAQDFFLREQFIKSHFSQIDEFISPSHFLAERYVDWGLPADRIRVIENMLEGDDRPNFDQRSGDRKVRVGFFGQINWFKGIDLVLDAVALLSESIRSQLSLEINGSGLDLQTDSEREDILRKVEASRGVIKLCGGYQRSELPMLMSATDWIVVPSKWWENSPMVILEARKNGVPVICSDIGGMAEKVEHGKTGLHFRARSADSLAEQITWVVHNRQQQPEFSRRMQTSYDAKASLLQHLELYQDLLEPEVINRDRRVA